jgi:hypothetical protein
MGAKSSGCLHIAFAGHSQEQAIQVERRASNSSASACYQNTKCAAAPPSSLHYDIKHFRLYTVLQFSVPSAHLVLSAHPAVCSCQQR